MSDLFPFSTTSASGFLPRGWRNGSNPCWCSAIFLLEGIFLVWGDVPKSHKSVWKVTELLHFKVFTVGEIFLVYFFGGFLPTTVCLISEFFS